MLIFHKIILSWQVTQESRPLFVLNVASMPFSLNLTDFIQNCDTSSPFNSPEKGMPTNTFSSESICFLIQVNLVYPILNSCLHADMKIFDWKFSLFHHKLYCSVLGKCVVVNSVHWFARMMGGKSCQLSIQFMVEFVSNILHASTHIKWRAGDNLAKSHRDITHFFQVRGTTHLSRDFGQSPNHPLSHSLTVHVVKRTTGNQTKQQENAAVTAAICLMLPISAIT